MTGNFTEDDIQHLLGVMNSSHEDSASSSSPQVPNPMESPAMQAAVQAAAAVCLPHSEPVAPNSDTHTEIHEEAKALARSERKRSREKQRRLDVNKQFNDLTKLVSQIEQEEREEDPTVFRQSFSATNRADLIARTIAHIERLRDSNKRRKTECANLQQQLQDSQKAGEEIAAKYKEAVCKNHGMMMPQQSKQVMMMVPMMMPANATQGMPQFGMQAPMGAMSQFMMPQAFMPQPAAAPAAAGAAPTVSQAQQQQQQQQQPPAQVPQQPQQHQQPSQASQHSQLPTPPAQPQVPVPTMMTPQQMMFTSMQSVYPTMAAATTPAQQQPQPQPQMPFMNFAMAPVAAPAPAPVVAEAGKPGEDAVQQQQQGSQPCNGQANSSSAGGGSNYAHCA